MRTALVALTLALASLPAAAEGLQSTNRSEEQQRADKEVDAAYKAMMKQRPDKQRNTDPWSGVRNRDASANQLPREASTHRRAPAQVKEKSR